MHLIKTLWPTPFRVKKGDLPSMVIQLVIFLVVCALAGIVLGLLSSIPLVGFVFSILGSVMGVYSLVGIVLCILKFLGSIS